MFYTKHASTFLKLYLQALYKKDRVYIKDTNDFIRKTGDPFSLTKESLLFAIDAVSLF